MAEDNETDEHEGAPRRPVLWPYAVGAGVAALVLRVPFRSSLPLTWDSVQYCLAIRHYNIELHQPHPPGYFLYAYCGKLIHALGAAPYAGLVGLSLVAGAIMAGVLAWWAGKLEGKWAALATGALAVVSPLAWSHATTGDTYALSGMLGALVAALCWKVYTSAWGGLSSPPSGEEAAPARAGKPAPRGGEYADVALSALALAVTAGVRPTDAAFLLPLWLYCVARRGGRALALGGAALVAVTAAWALPMLRVTGGLARYLEISHRFSAAELHVSPWAPGQAGWAELGIMGLAALSVLFSAWPLVPLARGSQLSRAWLFLALWLGPAVAFLIAVPLATPGHLMVLAPAPLLLAGLGLSRLRAGPQGGVRAGMLLGVVVLLNAGFLKLTVVDGHQEQERDLRTIQAACAPYATPDTAVLATLGVAHAAHADLSFRTAMYLLPECHVFLLPLAAPGTEGGIANEGFRMESSIDRPPVRVPARRALVDASLLKLMHGFPPPRLVVSNDQGEFWLVETPSGVVLEAGAIRSL